MERDHLRVRLGSEELEEGSEFRFLESFLSLGSGLEAESKHKPEE